MRHVIAIAVVGLIAVSAGAAERSEREFAAEAFRVESSMVARPLSCSSAPLLACSGSITASPSCLSDQYYIDLYTFNASAGQTVTLTATTSTGYQMLVTIQVPSGSILTSKFGPSPVSLTYTFPAAGTYYIGFGYVAQFAVGTYRLAASCSNATSGCQLSGTIGMGSSVAGSLTASNGTACLGGSNYSAVYSFNGTKDVPVLVTMSSSFPPYLEVDPSSEDGGVWKSATTAGTTSVVFLPPVTGSNLIYFSSYTASPTSGTYTIKVEPAPIDACRRRAVSH
jgi:hypothetical protein